MGKNCSSCMVAIANQHGTVEFDCPGCGKHRITRCPSCRKNAVKYTCPECNFEGPN